MTIHSRPLFVAVLLGSVFETGEVFLGSCAVWQQEFMLLAVIFLLSFVARGHKALMLLAAAFVIGLYIFEGYDQFIEGARCGPFASELNLLLIATIIAAAGLALGHQIDRKK